MPKVKHKPKAVVDTSFWIHLVKLGLVDAFTSLWDIVVTKKVEEELQAFTRIKLYLTLDLEIYSILKQEGEIQIKNPKNVPSDIDSQITKDSGELFSLALAKEEKIIVFIDNGISYDFCKRNSIAATNIVDFCLHLVENSKITKEDALEKLNILEKFKSMKLEYLENGREALHKM